MNGSKIEHSKKSSPKSKELIKGPFIDYLTERVWRLAGCSFENGVYMPLDANMSASRINFLKNGTFEAASGITNYAGTWKHKQSKNQAEASFRFQISSKKLADPSNTIGKPFDAAFEQNLKNTESIQISVNEIKFYSKDGELLLHFIRL
ncbi:MULTISPECIES: hypothetical protein [unclassified Treponema]|uniref:hypothetical protein n=1 Tax=unclassified Treponema TaxID=2638727 RepID=UPI0020A547B2|nr:MULTISPECIES: hypothetical protein [unclassified Treponema]